MQFEQMTIAALAAYLDQNEQLGAVEEEMLLADRRRGVHLLLERYKKRKASLQKEHVRLQKMLSEESYFWKKGYEFVAGVDEAGRGPLAGPVAAAAVILQPGVLIIGLNDSKKLSAGQRDELFVQIKKSALGTGVGIATREEIDRMNIHAASMLAMNRALEQLTHLPEMVLVDGFPIRGCRIKQKA
ncbi:MAG TPA: ribonuclease HII, partial [Candidatus Limnocylindrales bacterium]|nr:ribonuclease HII [Candidatus Limnocylindrales bacterium]